MPTGRQNLLEGGLSSAHDVIFFYGVPPPWQESSGLTPVIVLHGGPGHGMLSFKGSIDRLSAGGRPVLFYDQRGSGHSEMKGDEKVRVSLLIDDI